MNLIFRLLGVVVLFIDFILQPIFWLLRRVKSPKRLPPIDNQILLLSATELATRIRQRKVTSLYVVATYIGRMKQVNPIVNAISDERFDAALIDAKAADDFIASGKMTIDALIQYRPFLGVPVTVKESCGVKGMSYAVGSLHRKGFKCDADGASIQRLRQAGFIPLAVTNCPEYCSALETNNLLIGATNNPYNTLYSTGGSSGGEAALISSGASVVGIASDYCGSIRLPCAFTGIYGHKTTPKIVPRTMHFPNSTDPDTYEYFAIGPVCRYACDLKPMLQIISADSLDLTTKVNLNNIKILLTEDYDNLFGIAPVSQEIIKMICKSANQLKNEYKMKTEIVRFKQMHNAPEIGTSLFMDLKDKPNFLQDPDNPKKNVNLYNEIFKSILGSSHFSIHLLFTELIIRFNGFIPKSHLSYYQNMMKSLQNDVWNKLGDNAVLLFPSFPSNAFQHYAFLTKSLGISYSMIINILGCPSTQVPIGFDKNGMPIGMQIIAGPKQDRLCLAVAEALEQINGGWKFP